VEANGKKKCRRKERKFKSLNSKSGAIAKGNKNKTKKRIGSSRVGLET